MTRLAVPVVLPAPSESTRNLARTFNAINAAVSGVSVQCSICKTRDRVNSKLIGKGKRPPFICGECLRAS